MKKIKLLALLSAFLLSGVSQGALAQEDSITSIGSHKAYVYTELQISTSFDNVPWREMNPNLKKIPGLMNKTWLYGDDQSVGGFYVFDTVEHAKQFASGIFSKEAEKFGVGQTTKIFDAAQTESASRDMQSVFYSEPKEKTPLAFVYSEVQVSALPFNEKINWKKRNDTLKKQPGLLSKTWLSGLNTGTVGGLYAFDTIEHARDFAIKTMPKVTQEYQAAYITRVFDAKATEEASRDMGSLFYK